MATLTLAGGGTFPRTGYVYEGHALTAAINAEEFYLLDGATFEWKVGDRIVSTGMFNTYRVTDDDVGKTISVTALLRDASGHNTIRLTSSNAPIIADVNDPPRGSLGWEVAPLANGYKLTAVDRITDEDGRGPMRYQWFIDGERIANANGAELVLPQYAPTQLVEVQGSYTDSFGRPTTVSSRGIPPAVNAAGTVTISGDVAPFQAVRIDASDPNLIETIHYAWDLMDSQGTWTAVTGATGSSLMIGAAAPAAVRAFVDYADASGNVARYAMVLGSSGADDIRTAGYGETVLAGSGDDRIYFSRGTHRIDGGAGLDTYVSPSQYDRVFQSVATPGEWRVPNAQSNGEGILTNVERVQFSDRSVALDIDGNAGGAFRLYQAAFDRKPDDAGIGYWISRLDHGMSLRDIAQGFVNSAEFKLLYGAAPTNAEIVTKFYAHILDRAPDAGGLAYWVGILERGDATVANVLVNFSESPENVAALVGVLQNGVVYQPYPSS